MNIPKHPIWTALLCTLVVYGCRSESKQTSKEVILGKVELSDGWARPGTKGQTSGIYLTIANGTASVDTLIGLSTDVAKKAEIHESFKNEDDTIGMRPAGNQIIPQAKELVLKPGGLHIMLMNLNHDLALGDSVKLLLEFSRVGTKSITVPVKIQP